MAHIPPMPKGSREIRVELTRQPKRKKFKGIPKQDSESSDVSETSDASSSVSSSSRKLKRSSDFKPKFSDNVGYRIIDFYTVFSFLSSVVKCSVCDEDIQFSETSTRGLGFKIRIHCGSCEDKFVSSSPLIDGKAYEVNRRLTFAMRVIGVGYLAMKLFCGLMDFEKPVSSTFYNAINTTIHSACKIVAEKIMRRSAEEEKEETVSAGVFSNFPSGIAVSGDGSWRKRGFSSLHGLVSIIGHYTGKVIDVIVKSSWCQVCVMWEKKKNDAEYEDHVSTHSTECAANHDGSSGKMEVSGLVDLFKRSQQDRGVTYLAYIGDGDSKCYKAVVESKPYGDQIQVTKKEDINHVSKRMGRRLRDLKKKQGGLGGKGKLTGKQIDKLTSYYGKAIRDNTDSVEGMKRAIWASFYHRASTDSDPQHQYCPEGENSWCEWQRFKAKNGNLKTYKHPLAHSLPPEVMRAMKPVYQDLSKDDLLTRCLGAFSQNSNESFNNVVWKIAPKTLFSGAETVEIAAYIATCIYNEGHTTLMLIMEEMGISFGSSCDEELEVRDQQRILKAEKRCAEESKEGRMERKRLRLEALDIAVEDEGEMYGPGID